MAVSKWEARWDRLLEWFNRRSVPVQALIASVGLVFSAGLAIFLILALGVLLVNVFGWWLILLLPFLWLYFYFYGELYEDKKRRERYQ